MKKILIFLPLLILLVAACSSSHHSNYDPELCADLATKIERRDSISQSDYAEMIAQNEAILKYLIERTSAISRQPDSLRYDAWRTLTSEPEYLERFGYMFTLGSALYQADINNCFDRQNKHAYDQLDRYNTELADYTDRY